MEIKLWNDTKERFHVLNDINIDPIDNVSGDMIEIVLSKDFLGREIYDSIMLLGENELLHVMLTKDHRALIIIDALLELEDGNIIFRSEDYIWMKKDRPNLHLRVINRELMIQT